MNYFHVMNRGVDKRTIAQDNADRLRFVTSLYVMNDTEQVENTARTSLLGVRPRTDTRKRLVTIHAWCLMGNHYHLLLSENVEGGMSNFLKKLNVGYTGYFNLRHSRSGVLFQGKTKRVQIVTDRHFLYILPYIHLNPLDFYKDTKNWRIQCVSNPKRALEQVNGYRWSSLKNYSGELEFEPILAGSDLYADRKLHTTTLRTFLARMADHDLAPITLE